MRILSGVGAAAAAGLLALTAMPLSTMAVLNPDTTGPYGPFGFTTQGLVKNGSYGEPSLAIANDGTHVMASVPGCSGICYWYSADDGKTWGKTSTAYGDGDSELDFLPNGTALSADLNVGGSNTADSGIRVSHDFGKTWGPVAHAGMEQDRQWLAHSPDAKRLFLVYHDFAAEAEFISESDDGGLTWTHSPQDQIRVNTTDQGTALPILAGGQAGGTPSFVDQGVNTFSGPMVIDRNGQDYYVVYSISDAQSNVNPIQGTPPFGPTRAVVVAHSGDAGATWDNYLADVAQIDLASGAAESAEGAIFPWGFIDDSGTVYVVFNSTRNDTADHFHMYYVFSTEHGKRWSQPRKIDTLPFGKGAAVYATGASISKGVIDVAWYQTDNGVPSDDSSVWVPHFAQITKADIAPHVVEQAVTTVPNHKKGICLSGLLCLDPAAPGSHDRSLADFFELAVNPVTKMAEIAYADNGGRSAGGEVVFAKQTTDGTAAPSPAPVIAQATSMPNTVPAGRLSWFAAAAALGLLIIAAALRPRRES